MDHLQSAFITEAEEFLAALEGVLLEFEKDLTNKDSIEAIFRVMHSLKGSSSMFDFDHLSSLTHDLETIYDSIREGRSIATPEILEVTLQSVDHLNKIIKDKDLSDTQNRQRHADLLAKIKAIAAITEKHPGDCSSLSIATSQSATYYIRCKLQLDIFKNGTNPLYVIDDIVVLGTAWVMPVIQDVPELKDIAPDLCYTGFEIVLSTTKTVAEIQEVFIFIEHSCEIIISKISDGDLLSIGSFATALHEHELGEPPLGYEKIKSISDAIERESPIEHTTVKSNHKIPHVTSIRVSSDKLDELMNLISELVTSQASLSLLAQQQGLPTLVNLSERMEKITRRLRDNAFNICLIPLQTLETRFQRLVRDLSLELNKEIDFVAEGVETELDKSIIEKITDPILHILRNCIDHGIESPEERLMKGKKRQGRIEMKAFHSGTSVYILIKDDGKGIDAERIRLKAVGKGLIAEDAVLSEQDITELVFRPGFSTAERLTDVSGRGVGMDIVRKNIATIHGEVTLRSQPNVGTTITIKLPLTLSIVDGMLVRIASSEYILPLTAVDKCYEIKTEKLQPDIIQKIVLDGSLIPVFNLREAFEEQLDKPEVTQIIKLHYDDFPVGITVDAVIGEYQAVMKPLGNLYELQDEFSGATILGDGSVALVVDTNKLIQRLSIKAQSLTQKKLHNH